MKGVREFLKQACNEHAVEVQLVSCVIDRAKAFDPERLITSALR